MNNVLLKTKKAIVLGQKIQKIRLLMSLIGNKNTIHDIIIDYRFLSYSILLDYKYTYYFNFDDTIKQADHILSRLLKYNI